MSRPTRIVVALGGNALEDKNLPPTAESQAVVVERTAKILADISCGGYEMAVVHGNGPQVGRIILASEAAAEILPVPALPPYSAEPSRRSDRAAGSDSSCNPPEAT